MADLSVIIPARNEPFLLNTINDVLENIQGDTEIICILDGNWPREPIPDDPRVTLIHHTESIGQRAAINEAARVSRAKYVMKLDAHCRVGAGFDAIMMADMQDDWTMVPKMYNLHCFDWICDKCGHRRYQGPTPTDCPECDNITDFSRDIVWKAKPSPESTAMAFDSDLRFQYWGKYKRKQKGDLVETMSILGACFMLTRDKFFELNICDEGHGSWGQQGTEVACATWLSGGKLICNKKTWFAHLFRTQGGDFGFPYPLSGSEVNQAREYSRDLWLNNKHHRQMYPLSWLLEKFWPVPGWNDEDLDKLKEQDLPKPKSKKLAKGIVYYTDNRLEKNIEKAVQYQLLDCRYLPDGEMRYQEIVTVSLQEIEEWEWTAGDPMIVLPLERGYLTMFKQILAGLEESLCDIIFLCEHDVLYHPSHFDFTPERRDVYYYNQNVWKMDYESGKALFYYVNQTSGLCAYRDLLIEHYRERVRRTEEKFNELGDTRAYRNWIRRQGFEPGTHNRNERVDDYGHDIWMSEWPNVDIRHSKNLTPSRWSQDEFRNKRYCRGWTESDEVPGWGKINEFIKE